MATLKQIRQRIRSAKNIRQITRAMKLVAAARLKKAQDRVLEARPYSEKMKEFMANIGGAGELPTHPLLQKRPVERILVILVSSERGLAGSYNSNIIRKCTEFVKTSTAKVQIYAVGKKGNLFFGKRGYTMADSHTVGSAGATLEDAVAINKYATEAYESGAVDAVYLLYAKFISPIRQIPQAVQLLPIEPPKSEATPASAKRDYAYEPGPEELLGILLPKYTLTLTYQALSEATASEFGARMTAMTSATDAAGKMIESLTLKANRERQAAITKEILEVVGGAEALKG
jgi:F-type H+-transporting ATPase subunit gamma